MLKRVNWFIAKNVLLKYYCTMGDRVHFVFERRGEVEREFQRDNYPYTCIGKSATQIRSDAKE